MVLILAALGLFLCFWGGRLVRPALAVAGFVAGLIVGSWVGGEFGSQNMAMVLGGVGAIAAVVLVLLAFNTGLFILGALTGGVLYESFSSITGETFNFQWWGLIVSAGVVGLLSYLLRKQMVKLLSAIAGSYLLVEAGVRLAGGSFLEWGPPPQWAQKVIMEFAWVAFAMMGVFTQFAAKKRKKKEES